MSAAPTIVVMAKAPLPGRVKTRLCPPCTPAQAAELATAALQDTLAAVVASEARPLVALDGPRGAWCPPGIQVVTQQGKGLAARLAHATAGLPGPWLVIGMDTPQVTGTLLDTAVRRLTVAEAVLGPATDGGWWALGLRAGRDVFTGVPMSTSRTGHAQHRRLTDAGLRPSRLPELRDVDRIGDAWAVAREAPDTWFAHTLRALGTIRRRHEETPVAVEA